MVKENNDTIASIEAENQLLDAELEKCKNKLVDSKTHHDLANQKLQRTFEALNTTLQIRINELESRNGDLAHQMIELQQLLKKQKHEHILSLEQASREGHNASIKYRNDNTALTVQVSNYVDKIICQEKSFNSEISRLQNDCDRYHHESIYWKNETDFSASLLASSKASDERYKGSLIEAGNKLIMTEGINRDLETKLSEYRQEMSVIIDRNRMLEEKSYECSSLKEQIEVLNDAYEEEKLQFKTSLEDNRSRLEEDFWDKVSQPC